MSTNERARFAPIAPGDAEQKPLRVLLIAYQCAPEGGSVSMIGWRWYRYLTPIVSVHLVTHVRNREALAARIVPGSEVTYIDTERFAGPLYRLGCGLFGRSQHLLFMFASLDFLYFGRKVGLLFRKKDGHGRFDVCHVATPVSAVAPHRFGLLGLPTVLGPLNSGLTTVKGFPEILKAERAWLYRLRFLGRWLVGLWGTFRHADLIFSAGSATDRALGPRWRKKIVRLPENGVEEVADTVPPFPAGRELILLFAGRLVPIKGLSLLLRALARVGHAGIRLRIAGDGPMRQALEQQIASLGLAPRVEMLGQRPSRELTGLYRGCHLHVLPSIRESGGATILEAMAQGRPSAALDHGGPSQSITPETGFLLPCRDSDQVIDDLAALMLRLRRDRSILDSMAESCLEKARCQYTWHAKVEAALAAYQSLRASGVSR